MKDHNRGEEVVVAISDAASVAIGDAESVVESDAENVVVVEGVVDNVIDVDVKIVEERLSGVKTFLKFMDEVVLPEDGHYYERMHAKIMAALDPEIPPTQIPLRNKTNNKSENRAAK